MPGAVANKLVPLANHPSSRILQKFAVDAILSLTYLSKKGVKQR